MTLEQKEAALRGWNWGQVEFQGSNLAFSVANKPAFEVPLTEVANTSLASKTEVMIEFAPPEVKGPDGRALKIKVCACLCLLRDISLFIKHAVQQEDLLVEMRFFVPGMAASGQIAEDGGPARFKDASEKAGSTEVSGQEDGELNQADEELVVGEDGETLSAAAVFCETVKQKADIGAITSESIVRFEELLCLTPRLVFSVDNYLEKLF